MKKTILAIIFIIILCGIIQSKYVMAEDATVEIWSNSLDERIEHRSI